MNTYNTVLPKIEEIMIHGTACEAEKKDSYVLVNLPFHHSIKQQVILASVILFAFVKPKTMCRFLSLAEITEYEVVDIRC